MSCELSFVTNLAGHEDVSSCRVSLLNAIGDDVAVVVVIKVCEDHVKT